MGICYCDVGKHLSIHCNSYLIDTIHKTAIRCTILSTGRIDTGYPQTTIQTFFCSAVSVGITKSLFYSLLGLFETAASGTPAALGHVEYLFATTMGLKASCYSWHSSDSSYKF